MAEPFAAALSLGDDWREVADALGGRLAGAPGGLGLLYTAESFAPHQGEMLAVLRRRTGVEDWISAAGYGVIGAGEEHYGESGGGRPRPRPSPGRLPPLRGRRGGRARARGDGAGVARGGGDAARPNPRRPPPPGCGRSGGTSRGQHRGLPGGGPDRRGGRDLARVGRRHRDPERGRPLARRGRDRDRPQPGLHPARPGPRGHPGKGQPPLRARRPPRPRRLHQGHRRGGSPRTCAGSAGSSSPPCPSRVPTRPTTRCATSSASTPGAESSRSARRCPRGGKVLFCRRDRETAVGTCEGWRRISGGGSKGG